MLVLTRKVGDVIAIGDNIKIIVMSIKGKQVRLGIEADKSTVVHREEIYQKIKQEKAQASKSSADATSQAHELLKKRDFSSDVDSNSNLAEEKNKKLTINNPSRKVIRKIQVDGCLPMKGLRCDNMFEIDEPKLNSVIYLELKGEGVKKAYEQLVATMVFFEVDHRDRKKTCHIVAAKVPKLTTGVQKLKAEMFRKKQAKLTVSTIQGCESV